MRNYINNIDTIYYMKIEVAIYKYHTNNCFYSVMLVTVIQLT